MSAMKRSPVVIAGLAVFVCACFAVGIRQAHDVDRATSIMTGANLPTPAQAQRAQSLLNSAAWLYPGTEVDVLKGRLAIEQGKYAQAERIERRVTESEPLNVQGWAWLAHASNPTLATRALSHVAQLAPSVPGG
jgi:predicted Zn-dependent protease